MSTHSQARGTGTPLPFGAGLSVPAAQGSGQRPTRPPAQDREASVPEGRGGPPARQRVKIDAFLNADGGQPLDRGHAEALLVPLARGLSVAAAQGRLDRAMGAAAADSRFAPSPGDLEFAWRATEPVSAGAPSWSARAVAVGLGPAEPFAYLGARVLRALEAAPRVRRSVTPSSRGSRTISARRWWRPDWTRRGSRRSAARMARCSRRPLPIPRSPWIWWTSIRWRG